MYKLIMISIFFLNTQLLAEDTVRLLSTTSYTVYGFTDNTFTIGTEVPSGDASSESAPATIYVPMDGPNVGADTVEDYFTDPNVTTLFDKDTTTRKLKFPFRVSVGGTAKYVYAAIRFASSGEYIVAKRSLVTYTNATNAEIEMEVSPAEFCAQNTSECTAFSNAGSKVEKKVYLYFYLASGIIANGEPVTPDSNGVYFTMFMSNRTYSDTELHPILISIRTGDSRLYLKYQTDVAMQDLSGIKIYRRVGGALTENKPIKYYYSNSNGNLLSDLYTNSNTSSEIEVKNLTNDTEYEFGFLFVDKYRFGTVVSNILDGKPLLIQELLKKNGCFLLTAGFGEDHYVIDYFRYFRDQVLSKYSLGRAFIRTYYETAPKYALMIYKHEYIRLGIRAAAYSAYFIFNYIKLIISFIFLTVFGILIYRSKKNKGESLENRL